MQGRIQTGSYEKDGVKVYTTDVVAEKVKFLGRPGGSAKVEGSVNEDGFQDIRDDVRFNAGRGEGKIPSLLSTFILQDIIKFRRWLYVKG